MFDWLRRRKQPTERKENPVARAIVMNAQTYNLSRDDAEKISKEAYERNVIVYAAVNSIAGAAAAVPWYLRGSDGEYVENQENHPLLQLMQRPNPTQGGARFIKNLTSYLFISGNTYIARTKPTLELWALRPDRMRIKPGQQFNDIVAGYVYKAGINEQAFDPSEILHIKTFCPTDDYYGKSPLMVAAYSIDSHNALLEWNYNLLKNRAKLDGIFETEASLGEQDFFRLKEELKQEFSGKAGGVHILDNGLKWTPLSLSPTDLDYVAGERMLGRLLCVGLGFPPELLGDASLKTYANYQEARKALYEECILPYLDYLRDELNNWLGPDFPGVTLEYDKDEIPALQENRQVVFLRVQSADWLSVNEQREATGYDAYEEEDADIPRALLSQRAFASIGLEDADVRAEREQDDEAEEEEEESEPKPEPEKAHRAQTKIWRLDTEEKKKSAWLDIEKRRQLFERFYLIEFAKYFKAEGAAVLSAFRGAAKEDREVVTEAALARMKPRLEKLYTRLYGNVGKYFYTYVRDRLGKASGPKATKAAADARRLLTATIEAIIPKRVDAVAETTRGKIMRLLREGIFGGKADDEIANDISAVYEDQFIANRSKTIAETEVVAVSNYGSTQGAKSTGKELRKFWVTQKDSRVRDAHADAEAEYAKGIGIDDAFRVRGIYFQYPGDMSDNPPADLVVNCRCFLGFDEARAG